MQQRDDDWWREASEVPRRWFGLAIFYGVFAVACAAVVPYAYRLEHPGASIADGTVIAVADLRGGGDRIVTRFVDVHGRTRTTDDGTYMAPGARVGDVLPVIYDADGDWVRLVGTGERAMRWLFIGCAIGIALLAIACAMHAWRRLARNRWLVRHGTRVGARAPRIQWRSVGKLPPMWRVHASWRDERGMAWREVSSEWQPGAGWHPPAELPPLVALVDPERPQRAWLPLARVREPALSR